MSAERRRSPRVAAERRRQAGTIGYLWCRQCKGKFVVAGRRSVPTDGPSIELIVCPLCNAMRRMVLPPMVAAPYRVVSKVDKLRGE
jgi:hypothetical protein